MRTTPSGRSAPGSAWSRRSPRSTPRTAIGRRLAIRVGINTGLVVVGDIGTGESRDQMAVVGETPNVAARLQELAEPGSVVVGASTYRLIEGLFLCEDLGALSIKGVSAPVPAYRVREPTGASRFEATTTRGLTPLVGREDEVRLLLSRWRQAKEGEGQVVLLSGEPGIGKSRIIQSLREQLQDEPRVNLHYFCSPFYSSSALYPVLDQLERAADFRRHDPPTVKLEKLEALLGQASAGRPRRRRLLAPLLAIATEGRYPPLDLTPQQHRAKVFTTLLEQLAGLASRDPVLMIFEDAHWIDPTSIELFQQIVDRVQRLPVLLVMIFRPDFAPPWSGYPHISALSLGRLGHRQAAAMVERVTGGKPLPFEVVEQIVARTDGVPLFVEELTKTILEFDLLVDAGDRYVLTGPLPALAIPTHAARFADGASRQARPGQGGRPAGRDAGSGVQPRAAGRLRRSARRHWSRRCRSWSRRSSCSAAARLPEVTYEFKHALLQDAAYGSLLRAKRQQLHARIGQVLEERFPHTAEARPELLAHHFREAGLPERAIPYALQAGDAAVARYASAEARARYGAALEMARALPPAETASRARITAILKLAGVALNRDHFERDLKNLAEAAALAEELEDRDALSQIEYWIGRTNYVLGRFDAGADHARTALALAEAVGNDDTAGALPINLLARIHCLRGEAPEAIAYASRNVGQMRRLGNRLEEAAISGVLAFGYGLHGEFAPAFEAAQHGIELARKVEHLPTLAACLHFRGVAKGWHGEIDDSVADFEEALACSEKAGDVFRKYLIYGWRGEAYLLVDRIEAAEADLTCMPGAGRPDRHDLHRGAFQAFLARIRLLQGDLASALQIGDQALQIATDTGQPWSRSIALRVCAETSAGRRRRRCRECRACGARRDRDPGEARMPLRSGRIGDRAERGAGRQGRSPARARRRSVLWPCTSRWARHRASRKRARRWLAPDPKDPTPGICPLQLCIVTSGLCANLAGERRSCRDERSRGDRDEQRVAVGWRCADPDPAVGRACRARREGRRVRRGVDRRRRDGDRPALRRAQGHDAAGGASRIPSTWASPTRSTMHFR